MPTTTPKGIAKFSGGTDPVNVATLIQSADDVDAALAGAWQTLMLSASWVALSGFVTPRYRLEAGGTLVRVEAVIQSGNTTGTTVFATLPAGFRPAATTPVLLADGNNAHARFTVTTGGALTIQSGFSATATSIAVTFGL